MNGKTMTTPIETAILKLRADRVVTIRAERARIKVLSMIQSAAGAGSPESFFMLARVLFFSFLAKRCWRRRAVDTAENTSMVLTPTLATNLSNGVYMEQVNMSVNDNATRKRSPWPESITSPGNPNSVFKSLKEARPATTDMPMMVAGALKLRLRRE